MNKEQIEQAANEYADKHAFRVPYNGTNKFYDDNDLKWSKEGFIAGATWQQSQSVEQPVNADILGAAKLTIAMINGMSPQVQQEGNMPLMMLMAKYIVSLENSAPEMKWVSVNTPPTNGVYPVKVTSSISETVTYGTGLFSNEGFQMATFLNGTTINKKDQEGCKIEWLYEPLTTQPLNHNPDEQ